MALDGAFLYQIKKELEETMLQARVEKVYQPSKEEIVLSLRGRNCGGKLLLSARANSARIHFTQVQLENPLSPPMFCMLLRKRLASARLAQIRQPGLERVLALDFDCVNELGDEVRLSLIMEIMGRYSNIILVDENGKIVDAVKRVDAEMSSERLILPGLAYQMPPQQNKRNLLATPVVKILEELKEGKNAPLSKALLSVLQGISPVVCRELQHQTCRGGEAFSHELTGEQKQRLSFFLEQLKEKISSGGKPVMILELSGKPMDFSFVEINQYGTGAVTREYPSYHELLDAFYTQRDRIERMRSRSLDLLRLLANTTEKLSRKINLQQEELKQCGERETLRMYGDLLNANLYRLEKGSFFAQLENFYDPQLPEVRIPLDPALTPVQNAQKYYKEYRKAQTAEQMLTQQIHQAREELDYLDTVFDALSRAQTEKDLNEIREELQEQGYLKRTGGKEKRRPTPMAEPLKFVTSGGYTVLVGRNNKQNDKLTLKTAQNNDIWFHTKNIPGSHTILVTGGKEPEERDMREAAQLAAYHSKGAESSQVPVDYTQVRYVRKPQGAKPGMVIYDNYRTVYVTPQCPVENGAGK